MARVKITVAAKWTWLSLLVGYFAGALFVAAYVGLYAWREGVLLDNLQLIYLEAAYWPVIVITVLLRFIF